MPRLICALSLTFDIIASITAGRAQDGTPGSAPVYYVADFEVTDREAIKPYSAGVEATFKPYGGHFIVRGSEPVPLEGRIPKGRLVIIAFDSMDKAKGVGELGLTVAAAAVADAAYNATGVRVRDYPVTLDKLIHHLPDMA